MALYRTFENLSTGQRRGQIFKSEMLSDISVRILEDKGVIRKIQTPPLEILEGWQARAEILAKYEIVTIGDLLYAEGEEIKEDIPDIELWKNEAFTFIAGEPSPELGCTNCRKRR